MFRFSALKPEVPSADKKPPALRSEDKGMSASTEDWDPEISLVLFNFTHFNKVTTSFIGIKLSVFK